MSLFKNLIFAVKTLVEKKLENSHLITLLFFNGL